MTTLTLVRHGTPAFFHDGRSDNDPPLTLEGRVEAEAVRDYFARTSPGFTHMLTSRVRRAYQTAEIISPEFERYGFLNEWNQPQRWHGLDSLETVHEELEAYRQINRQKMWQGIDGGEDIREYIERVIVGIDDWFEEEGVLLHDFGYLRRDQSDGLNVLVVAHHGVIGVITNWLLHNQAFPDDIWLNYELAFCGMTQLKLIQANGYHKWRLVYANKTSHLGKEPEELLTKHGRRV